MKQFKSIMSMTLMVAAVMYMGVNFACAVVRDAMPMDKAPGPAYATVDGKISKIEGSVYTIQIESTGYQNLAASTNISESKIYVGEQTKKLHGNKKVGDKVRAEITRGGFANSIQ